MLPAFCSLRRQMGEPLSFSREDRCVRGMVAINPANIVQLRQLEDHGYLKEALINGEVRNLAVFDPPPGAGVQAQICLCPVRLGYFEDFTDLLQAGCEEREHYYLHPLGDFHRDQATENSQMQGYRAALRAWQFLRGIADLDSPEKTILLTPERLEIPFVCAAEHLVPLPALTALESELAPAAVERDQRLALFKRSLRDHLLTCPTRERFGAFLQHFDSIYDAYRRDFLLWVGKAFGELEKTFEEKRLKFIADLNGILGGIQASLLAVPLAALLVGDKFDVGNPLKNFFLALAVDAVALIANLLLANQKHALDAARDSIAAMQEDFVKKQSQRKDEFRSRLNAVSEQQTRVRRLLKWFRSAVWAIAAATTLAWVVSLAMWLTATPARSGTPAGVPPSPPPSLSPTTAPNVSGTPASSPTP